MEGIDAVSLIVSIVMAVIALLIGAIAVLGLWNLIKALSSKGGFQEIATAGCSALTALIFGAFEIVLAGLLMLHDPKTIQKFGGIVANVLDIIGKLTTIK